MKAHKTKVAIVIPNWNGKELLRKHLPYVLQAAKGVPIVIVDDASTDDSVEFVKKKFPGISIVEKQKHEGFAATVNAGVERLTEDVVILLNTDVQPEKDFLTPLLSHFSDPSVFAVGCLDKSPEGDTVVLRGRGVARWEKGFFIHRRGEVDKTNTAWVSGGSGAFRKSIWDTLGGMDTLYNPFYWEDIDLSYRAVKAGYKLVFEPKSRVLHLHEEGKIKKEFANSEVQRIAYRNQFIFIWKNLSDTPMILQHFLWLPVRIIQAGASGNMNLIGGFLSALWRLPSVIGSRQHSSKHWKRTDSQVTSILA